MEVEGAAGKREESLPMRFPKIFADALHAQNAGVRRGSRSDPLNPEGQALLLHSVNLFPSILSKQLSCCYPTIYIMISLIMFFILPCLVVQILSE
jgi:hypothetical protein